MYILTYPNGEAAWFENMGALLENIEYDAFVLNDCGVYFLHPNSAWIDASKQVMDAIDDYEQCRAWDSDHVALISSPEKTGRV